MRRLAASLLMWLPTLNAIAELTPFPAEVAPIRAFGYQLGDVVEQRVLLEIDDSAFNVADMPPLGRVGNWFARRSAERVDSNDGHGWLVLRYQLINAPSQLRVVALPGLTLDAAGGGPGLKIAAVPLSIAPISRRDAFTESGLGELRPDRRPAAPAPGPLAARLRWTLAALALWLVGWTGWWQWRIRRDRATLPFARAWAAMRRIADGDAAGWHALHRAFDASAGGVVDRSSTERLFARRPEFRPLAGDIERFYRLSAARFFADRQAADEFSPRRLCRALMRIERRHSR
ncbi:MAG: calcium incorporation protein MxaA [Zoogloeaceae bacterium]|nr:hypothetical protein [Rhodocyclaceae bacterium]MCP5234363.1 calcium incorporation protein MxaA [Zoogloeaceae bacterium]